MRFDIPIIYMIVPVFAKTGKYGRKCVERAVFFKGSIADTKKLLTFANQYVFPKITNSAKSA